MNFSNFTRDVLVDGSSVDTVFITTPQVTITQAIRENSTVFTGTDYATDLPREFTDRGGAFELVSGITQSVINESGALSAWDKVSAIADFLTNGNDTFTFLRNNNGTEAPDRVEDEGDLAYWMLNNSFEEVVINSLRCSQLCSGPSTYHPEKLQGFPVVIGTEKHSKYMERISHLGSKYTCRPIRT